MASLFRPNRNLDRELQAEPEFQSALAEAAKPAAAAANRMASRIMPSRSGPGIVVEEDRESVKIVNTDHGGHLDEWGSINNAPNASLRRGVREVGMRFEEE